METAASGGFLGVGLELGGKDPGYVRADADLAHAVETLVDGAFFNSGQSCCGIERIYVDRRVYKDFVEGCRRTDEELRARRSARNATTLGPLVRPEAAAFVRGQIAEAVRAGREDVDRSRSCLRATRSARPIWRRRSSSTSIIEMSLMREESFGPVVGIMPVDDDEEAVRLMNDSPYGLTAAIFTRGRRRGRARSAREIETGTVFMNRCDYLDPALAWTGVKDTGRGVTLSRLGYETLTRPKSFHLRTQL